MSSEITVEESGVNDGDYSDGEFDSLMDEQSLGDIDNIASDVTGLF